MSPKPFFLFLFALLSGAFPAQAQEASHAQVELLSEVSSLTPGKSVTLGLHFKMEKSWHIYWTNPGDSGMAPSVKWALPPGFEVGGLLWPVPLKLAAASLLDYGYEGEVLLLAPLKVPTHLKPGQKIKLSAKVRWLVCHDVCIPGQGDLSLELPVRERRMDQAMKWRDLFNSARKGLPLPLPENWRVTALGKGKETSLTCETSAPVTAASFLPLQPGQIENATPQAFHLIENGFGITLKRSGESASDVQDLEGILLTTESKEGPKAYQIKTKWFKSE